MARHRLCVTAVEAMSSTGAHQTSNDIRDLGELPPPLVVIVGPTASGKTALAVELAKRYHGEVISADSRAIYKGMDIGAAKPTMEERKGVPHWGFDLVEPGERFTAADFQRYATKKIAEIRARGHVPFLVGGTGLYVDAVIFSYEFGTEGTIQQRRKLEQLTLEQLHDYCIKNNISLPENHQNKRYVIRAIEQKGAKHKRNTDLLANCIVVGIATDREVLRTTIRRRAEQILTNSVVEEATLLGKKYGWENEAMTGNVYPLMRLYLENKISKTELVDKLTTADWRLAKRQYTWLRRNNAIYWGDREQIYSRVVAALEHKM